MVILCLRITNLREDDIVQSVIDDELNNVLPEKSMDFLENDKNTIVF